MSTVQPTDLLAITRPSGGDAGTYKVAVSDIKPAPASETAAGIVELATAAETQAGTDGTRAVHPAGLKAVTDAERTTSDSKYVDTAGDTMTGDLTVPSINGGPLAGFRNVLINPADLQGTVENIINQRGYVFGTATTQNNQYCIDRWRVVVSGQSLGAQTDASQTFLVAPAGGVEQSVEYTAYGSGVYTLSWEGTATATISSGSAGYVAIANGGQFLCTRGNALVIRLSGGTFRRVQFEPGPIPTPFEHRPPGTELALCERYYQQSWTGGLGAATNTDGDSITCALGNGAGRIQGITFLRSTMRATPTVVEHGTATLASGWALTKGSGTPIAKTGILAAKGDRRTIKVIVPVGGVSFGQAYHLVGNWSADAEL